VVAPPNSSVTVEKGAMILFIRGAVPPGCNGVYIEARIGINPSMALCAQGREGLLFPFILRDWE
jgi:hypothetical protein